MVVHTSGLVDYQRRKDYFLVNYQIRKVCAQDDPGRVIGTVQDVVQGAYSVWNPPKSRGSSFISKKRQASHWPSLVCFISPPLLNGFQSSLISMESYCQGESNAVCYEGQGLLLLENVGNYRNCTTWIILEPFGISNPDLSFLDIPPYD